VGDPTRPVAVIEDAFPPAAVMDRHYGFHVSMFQVAVPEMPQTDLVEAARPRRSMWHASGVLHGEAHSYPRIGASLATCRSPYGHQLHDLHSWSLPVGQVCAIPTGANGPECWSCARQRDSGIVDAETGPASSRGFWFGQAAWEEEGECTGARRTYLGTGLAGSAWPSPRAGSVGFPTGARGSACWWCAWQCDSGTADAETGAKVEAASCRFGVGKKAARRRFYSGQRPAGGSDCDPCPPRAGPVAIACHTLGGVAPWAARSLSFYLTAPSSRSIIGTGRARFPRTECCDAAVPYL